MSLGGNIASGYTDSLTEKAVDAGKPKLLSMAVSNKCCIESEVKPVARYPSMVLLSKHCMPISPAQFSQYPKVAGPSSIRTQSLADTSKCSVSFDPISRFVKYQRYQVPVPCQPLPASANMAGISQPTSLQCNIYPNT